MGCRSGDKRQQSVCSPYTVYVHGTTAPGKCRAARKAVEGEGLQRWCVGCRSGDKRQRSICSVCTIHIRGRVAPGKCRGSEEGGEGWKVYRAGAWAVGQATGVSGAYIVCIGCTYMEDSLLGV